MTEPSSITKVKHSGSGFPTGQTVPFPYETPYPQQIDFMDAILSCLRKRHDEETKEKEESQSRKTTPTKKNTKKRASVMMLESPTGTGKSLSLACAAVGWLRHAEQTDLQGEQALEKESHRKSASSSASPTGLDWLDSWVAPEEQQTIDQKSDGRQRANEARQKLEMELSKLRIRLKVKDQKDTSGNGTNRSLLRERRENLARSAVTASKMAERKRRRKQGRVIKRPMASSVNNNTANEDFCLDDYQSEDDNNANISDGDGSDIDERSQNNNPSSLSDAASLLNGGSLDGSGIDPRHSNWRQQSQSTSQNLSSNHKTHPKFSIGSVAPGSGVRKIIYAARTHSQLSQFVSELRRTQWGPTLRVVALGGRQALCNNTDVKGTGRFPKSEATISEACLDLQKGTKPTSQVGQKRKGSGGSSSSSKGCPLLASKDATSTLALHILAQPSDIEDAARLGKASHTCAYYASRESLAAAEVVVLPYSMLLSKSARSAVGLSLQESLVIVDEAHNLPEALRSLHSCRLTLPIAKEALEQLAAYTTKYASRLAGRNLYYLGQIRKCLNAFIKHLSSKPQGKATDENSKRMMSSGELLMKLRLDSINLFKILRYLEHSRLPQKLLGFTNIALKKKAKGKEDQVSEDDDVDCSETGLSKHISPMSIVQTFLEHLTSSSSEGKIVTDWPRKEDGTTTATTLPIDSRSRNAIQQPTLRYVLLHPAAHFQNVLEEAHAVALVGGTLRPFAHVATELLECNDIIHEATKADTSLRRLTTSISPQSLSATTTATSSCFVSPSLTTFTCDHVVPSNNVMMACLSMGPNHRKLDFRHQSRSTNIVVDELGQTILKLSKVVPSGMVVFLPSYSYEAHLVRRWKTTGLLADLNRQKKVHREPKSSQQVEVALESYSRDALSSPCGALLLSVIGGKMSEGINFSNDMARCVVVVGLPYPDITDPELKEKMSNMDQQNASSGMKANGITGQAYYQNLCMRAVNQSIGRAIRHANDYAAIILCDARYGTDCKVWSALPHWVRRGAISSPTGGKGGTDSLSNNSRQIPSSCGQVVDCLIRFFGRRKDGQN